METAQTKNFKESNIFELFGIGSMNFYLTPAELSLLFSEIILEFPEVVREVNVGETYLG